MSDAIKFEVETSRILEILSKEIYDSPLALLRENLQNAYDAVLMRCVQRNDDIREATIHLVIEPSKVRIIDTGIGMTEDVLRQNFWKAGSSGKRGELARRAGVVGTFGIGAMANFGVCSILRVETRAIDSDETLISVAERASLSIAKECISLERVKDSRGFGTTVVAEFEQGVTVTEAAAQSYLEPYVAFLPAKVFINDKLISQQTYERRLPLNGRTFSELSTRRVKSGIYEATVTVSVDQTGVALCYANGITAQGSAIAGECMLLQGGGQIMGLRTSFGLAPAPVSGHYQLGGFANLSILQPTAGREALSRESIEHVGRLVTLCEAEISESIAKTDAADKNVAFMQWLLSHATYNLAGRIKVRAQPEDIDIAMDEIREYAKSKQVHFYTGRDQSTQRTFAGEGAVLLQVSQSNPRRRIQHHYLQHMLKIPEVPDSVRVDAVYRGTALSIEEASVLIRIMSTLSDDYLMPKVDVALADISHGVSILTKKEKEQVIILISRGSGIIRPLVECYKTAWEVFPGFVKDFVRVHVYPKVQQHVPSATREGADALRKLLQRNRELYRYEESEQGRLEHVLGDWLAGDLQLGDVLKVARSAARAQTQTVSKEQVGRIEQEIPDVVQSPAAAQAVGEGVEYQPAPPIMRTDIMSQMKMLVTAVKYPQLNNVSMLLGLSDRLVKSEGDFFHWPHTTKMIWGGHRVIYIFTDASGRLTLYYDIELHEPLDDKTAGGGMFPTTTLITKDRIYVPVPDALIESFRITEGAKEFYVRFDTISNEGG
jgi:molecular chaperone HtpG